MVQFSDVVKNLGLLIDSRLSWRNQVSHAVSRKYAILTLLQRLSSGLGHLPSSYDVFLPLLSSGEFRRLSLAFNACITYVYCLKRSDHIFPFARSLLGFTLKIVLPISASLLSA
jgi:hypothetical protein